MPESANTHSELVPVLTMRPKDCTGDCDYAPCNCSGEWQVEGYTRESVERLVEQYEVACRDRDTFKRGVNENAAMVEDALQSLEEQYEALEKAARWVYEKADERARNPVGTRNGVIGADAVADCLRPVLNPASEPKTCPECGRDLHGYHGPLCRYCDPKAYTE